MSRLLQLDGQQLPSRTPATNNMAVKEKWQVSHFRNYRSYVSLPGSWFFARFLSYRFASVDPAIAHVKSGKQGDKIRLVVAYWRHLKIQQASFVRRQQAVVILTLCTIHYTEPYRTSSQLRFMQRCWLERTDGSYISRPALLQIRRTAVRTCSFIYINDAAFVVALANSVNDKTTRTIII